MESSKWNHRVLAYTHEDEVVYQVHEVYYTDDKPTSYTKSAVRVSALSLEGLKWEIDQMQKCLDKPTLSGDNFPEEFKTNQKEQ